MSKNEDSNVISLKDVLDRNRAKRTRTNFMDFADRVAAGVPAHEAARQVRMRQANASTFRRVEVVLSEAGLGERDAANLAGHIVQAVEDMDVDDVRTETVARILHREADVFMASIVLATLRALDVEGEAESG